MYPRHTSIKFYSPAVEPPLSSSTLPGSASVPKHVEHQPRKIEMPETTSASPAASSSRGFVAIVVRYFATGFTLSPATSATETGLSLTSTVESSDPVILAQGISSTSSTPDNGPTQTSSEGVVEIGVAKPSSSADLSTSSISSSTNTIQPSVSTVTSNIAPTRAVPANIRSARTTGMIIGIVFGGLALLLMIILAIVYVAWRKRRRRRDQADGEDPGQQQQQHSSKDVSGAGSTPEERNPSTDSITATPSQGAAPETLRAEPILADAESPMSPILPHQARWTSDRGDMPTPAGHRPLFANSAHDPDHHSPLHSSRSSSSPGGRDDDDAAAAPEQDYSSFSFFPAPAAVAPATTAAAAAADDDAADAPALLFDSISSRSSKRSSARDSSSAPGTALSMPPPPPCRQHTGASGQGGGGGAVPAARSRRGSSSSAVGGAGGRVASPTRRPRTPPPPLPVRSAARSSGSFHFVEHPGAWI